MGEALARGLLASGWALPGEVVVVEPSGPRRQELDAGLAARFPSLRVVAAVEEVMAAGGAGGAVVAVKPADAEVACRGIAALGFPRVLSIVAGVTVASLEGWLGGRGPTAVVRAMPNTPALIGAGASALAAGDGVTEEDLAWGEGVLGALGTVVRVAEAQLDAVTALSGSGPGYVFLLAEALVDAGVLVGLPRPLASALTVQTLLGSARLLAETDDSPVALRAAVTSPGGTTAAGLRVLEAAGLRGAVLDAVAAAAERARQLGAR